MVLLTLPEFISTPLRWRNRRIPTFPWAMLLGVMLLLLVFPTTTSAHALLVLSEPEDGQILEDSPGQVLARFNHELDSRMSSMRVFDAQDRQVDNGDGGVNLNDLDHITMVAGLPPELPDGRYTVRWTVVSAEDGDTTEGEFEFVVGSGTIPEAPAAPPANTALVWLIGGVAIVLVFLVLAIFRFGRRKENSQ